MTNRYFPEARASLPAYDFRAAELIARGINPYNPEEAGRDFISEGRDSEDGEELRVEPSREPKGDLPQRILKCRRGSREFMRLFPD